MQAASHRQLADATGGAGRLALLLCSSLLAACADDHPRWMDQATLIIRPSHRQAIFAYSFGGGEPSREEAGALVERNVAATIGASIVVRDNPMPSLDSVDFKGGRLLIHPPRNH